MPLRPERTSPKPFWMSRDRRSVKLYHGDTLDLLSKMPSGTVQTCITSPPYWGLRNYGVEGQLGLEKYPDCNTKGQSQCGNCYVCNTVAWCRQVYRILREDGTFWLNLGDSYTSGGRATFRSSASTNKGWELAQNNLPRPNAGLPPGNLVGMPWRVALSLQEDGWVLRQDVIWHKPSPMPESVRDRCTKAHEYVFLLTKGKHYYYDSEAIKDTGAAGVKKQKHSAAEEYAKGDTYHRTKSGLQQVVMSGKSNKRDVWCVNNGKYDSLANWLQENYHNVLQEYIEQESNKADVWRVASQGYKGAHFATFPPKLIEPMILASTSEYGACSLCHAPYERLVEKTKLYRDRPNDYVKRTGEPGTGNCCPNTVAGVRTQTKGWQPSCNCSTTTVKPCVVCDPFLGSGTTCVTAVKLGRSSWGIDINQDYLTEHAIDRISKELESKRTHL